MPTHHYQHHWQNHLSQYGRTYSAFARDDAFRWHPFNATAHGSISQDFLFGMNLLYADLRNQDAAIFHARCVGTAGRLLAANFFQSEPASSWFPRNRAVALRALTYAEAISSGKFQYNNLELAAVDFETAIPWGQLSDNISTGKKVLTDQDADIEGAILRCVRLGLIAGDFDSARIILGRCDRFVSFPEEMAFLRRLCSRQEFDEEAALEVDRYFDRARDPEASDPRFAQIELHYMRLEIAILRDRVLSREPSPNWNRVVASVSL